MSNRSPFSFLVSQCCYPFVVNKNYDQFSVPLSQWFDDAYSQCKDNADALQTLEALFRQLCENAIHANTTSERGSADQIDPTTRQAPQWLIELANFFSSTELLSFWQKGLVYQAILNVRLDIFVVSGTTDQTNVETTNDTGHAFEKTMVPLIQQCIRPLIPDSTPLSRMGSSLNLSDNNRDKEPLAQTGTILTTAYAFLSSFKKLHNHVIENIITALQFQAGNSTAFSVVQHAEKVYSYAFQLTTNIKCYVPFVLNWDTTTADPFLFRHVCQAEQVYLRTSDCSKMQMIDPEVLEILFQLLARDKMYIRTETIAWYAMTRSRLSYEAGSHDVCLGTLCASIQLYMTRLIVDAVWYRPTTSNMEKHVKTACSLLWSIQYIPKQLRPDSLCSLCQTGAETYYGLDTTSDQPEPYTLVQFTHSSSDSAKALGRLGHYLSLLTPYWRVVVASTTDVFELICAQYESSSAEKGCVLAKQVAADQFTALRQLCTPTSSHSLLFMNRSTDNTLECDFWEYLIQLWLSIERLNGVKGTVLCAMLEATLSPHKLRSQADVFEDTCKGKGIAHDTVTLVTIGEEEDNEHAYNVFSWCFSVLTRVVPSSYDLQTYLCSHVRRLIQEAFSISLSGSSSIKYLLDHGQEPFDALHNVYARLQTLPSDDLYHYVVYPLSDRKYLDMHSVAYANFYLECIKPLMKPFTQRLHWQSTASSPMSGLWSSIVSMDEASRWDEQVEKELNTIFQPTMDSTSSSTTMENEDDTKENNDNDNDSDNDNDDNKDVKVSSDQTFEYQSADGTTTGENEEAETDKGKPGDLFLAAFNGHLDTVRELVSKNDTDVNQRNPNDGATPLFAAAQEGYIDIVCCLVSEGNADCQTSNKTGVTPLHIAAAKNQRTVVTFLAQRNDVNVNTARSDGVTPIFEAAAKGFLDIVSCLIVDGHADYNRPAHDGKTPLMIATSHNHFPVVEKLLEQDQIDVDACDKSGNFALSLAAYYGLMDIVQCLLTHGNATPNQEHKSTPLVDAVRNGHVNFVRWFRQEGWHTENSTSACQFLLGEAVQSGSFEMVQYFMKDENIDGSGDPLCAACATNVPQIVKYMVENGANPNQSSSSKFDCKTPLYIAASNGYKDVVHWLLKETDIRIWRPQEGVYYNPIVVASRNGWTDIVRYFVEYCQRTQKGGPDVFQTALFHAVIYGHFEVVQCLLEEYDDVHVDIRMQIDGDTMTPLFAACLYSEETIVRYLVHQHDADTTFQRPSDQMSCLAVACQPGNKELIRCLVEDGHAPVSSSVLSRVLRNGPLDVIRYLFTSNKTDVSQCLDVTKKATPYAMAIQYGLFDVSDLDDKNMLVTYPSRDTLECYLRKNLSLLFTRSSPREIMRTMTLAAMGDVAFDASIFDFCPLIDQALCQSGNNIRMTRSTLKKQLLEIAIRSHNVECARILATQHHVSLSDTCQPIHFCRETDEYYGLNTISVTLQNLRDRDVMKTSLCLKDLRHYPPLLVITPELLQSQTCVDMVKFLLYQYGVSYFEQRNLYIHVIDDDLSAVATTTSSAHNESSREDENPITRMNNDDDEDASHIDSISNNEPTSEEATTDGNNHSDKHTDERGRQQQSTTDSTKTPSSGSSNVWYRQTLTSLLQQNPWHDGSNRFVSVGSRRSFRICPYEDKSNMFQLQNLNGIDILSKEDDRCDDQTVHIPYYLFTTFGFPQLVVTHGKWYFECELVHKDQLFADHTDEYAIQIGWGISSHFQPYVSTFGDEKGVGDDNHSWAFDPIRASCWHDAKHVSWGCSSKKGSVVSCLVDMDNGTISFAIDGTLDQPLGIAFDHLHTNEFWSSGVFPAFSGLMDCFEEASMHVYVGGKGTSPKYTFDGYRPIGESVIN